MKIIGIIVLLAVTLSVLAQTSPKKQIKPTGDKTLATADSSPTNQNLCCRHPLRQFGQAEVNLTPLFQWWKQHGDDAARPFPAWHRITGKKITDLGYSWVIDTKIYTNSASSTSMRIFLNNPPIKEEKLYYQLQNQLANDTLELTNDLRVSQAKTPSKPVSQTVTHTVNHGKTRTIIKNNNNNQAAAQNQRAALADEQQLQPVVTSEQKKSTLFPPRMASIGWICSRWQLAATNRACPFMIWEWWIIKFPELLGIYAGNKLPEI